MLGVRLSTSLHALTFWDSKHKQKREATGYHEQAVRDTAAETEKGKGLLINTIISNVMNSALMSGRPF